MIKLALFGLFISLASHAQEFLKQEKIDACVTKDAKLAPYTDSFKKMKDLYDKDLVPPVRDQDSIGWCYAYAAADLTSSYMAKNSLAPYKKGDFASKNNKSYVSANGVAHQYNLKKGDKLYDEDIKYDGINDKATDFKAISEGGDIEVALKIIVNDGFCMENQLSSEDNLVPELKGKYLLVKEVKGYKRTDDLRLLYNQVYNGLCDPQTIKTLLPDITDDSIEILKKLKGREAMRMLSELACPKNSRQKLAKKPKVISVVADGYLAEAAVSFTDNSKVMSTLDKALNDGNLAAIEWDAKLLFKEPDDKVQTYPHSTLVVGKSLDKYCRPVYVIKNSYGEHGDPNGSKCEDLIKRKSVDKNPAVTCEGGNLLIPIEDIKKTVSRVTYLE